MLSHFQIMSNHLPLIQSSAGHLFHCICLYMAFIWRIIIFGNRETIFTSIDGRHYLHRG